MKKRNVEGIGGWLILVLIGLIYILITTGIDLISYISWVQHTDLHEITSYSSKHYNPYIKPQIILNIVFGLIRIGFPVWALILMFKKSPFFPRLMIICLIGSFFLTLIDWIFGYLFMANLNASFNVNPPSLLDDMMNSLGALVRACIWIPYFIWSKRVKATFLKWAKIDDAVES